MRIGVGYAGAATQSIIAVYFKVSKRAAPASSEQSSMAISGVNGNYAITSYTLLNSDRDSITLQINASSGNLVTREVSELLANNTSGAYMAWDSEIN